MYRSIACLAFVFAYAMARAVARARAGCDSEWVRGDDVLRPQG